MNAFIPNNPNTVILLDTKGNVLERADNIAPDFQVKVVRDRTEFNTEAANKPFRTDRPLPEQQTLSSAASKARYATKG
jgi:hypothetical protein